MGSASILKSAAISSSWAVERTGGASVEESMRDIYVEVLLDSYIFIT
jgi:hypothetical protein